MQDDTKISAIIPVFNREKTVGRAIESALVQEFAPSEIIVVDDGSKDATRKIVESFGNKCRHIYQPNAGVSAARNKGVNEAESEWIAFLDSDDYWDSRHLLNLADAIRATNGEASLYFCDAKLPPGDPSATLWDWSGFKITPPYLLLRDAAPWVIRPVQPMLLQASAIKRASYLDVGGLPPDLRAREDTYLFFKLGLLYAACAVSGCGTVMTSEGSMRLTREISSATLSYWQATLAIHGEMLSTASAKRPEYRGYFIHKLSETYFSLGRFFYRKKIYSSSIKNLLRSAGRSPSAFMECLLESLGSRTPKE